MGNKKMRKRKCDRTRDDDVSRDLDQNVDDMNVQNQTQEEIEPGIYKYCKFV